MALESIARCDNCKTLKSEGNNWHMGEIRRDAGIVKVIIYQYAQESAYGLQTWCGIPCIQQSLGKELEKGATAEVKE